MITKNENGTITINATLTAWEYRLLMTALQNDYYRMRDSSATDNSGADLTYNWLSHNQGKRNACRKIEGNYLGDPYRHVKPQSK